MSIITIKNFNSLKTLLKSQDICVWKRVIFKFQRLAAVTRCLFNGEIENSREANSLYRMLTVALYSLCFAARSDPASLSSFLSLLTGCPLPPPTLPL